MLQPKIKYLDNDENMLSFDALGSIYEIVA